MNKFLRRWGIRDSDFLDDKMQVSGKDRMLRLLISGHHDILINEILINGLFEYLINT